MTDWLPKIKKKPAHRPATLVARCAVARGTGGGGDAVERGSVLIKNNKDPRLVTCDVTRDT